LARGNLDQKVPKPMIASTRTLFGNPYSDGTVAAETGDDDNEALQISFTGSFFPVLGTFNTRQSTPLFEGVVAPAASVVTPTTSSVAPSTSMLSAVKTHLSPAVDTTLTGSTINGIEEWTLPTFSCAQAGPSNLFGNCYLVNWPDLLGESLIFTERTSNQIGVLTPLGGKHLFGEAE
jgi:hypothetical protein